MRRSAGRQGSVAPDAESSGGVLERIVSADFPFPEARRRVIEELEQRYIERVLARHGGNITRAAEASGIARRQLQRVRVRSGK